MRILTFFFFLRKEILGRLLSTLIYCKRGEGFHYVDQCYSVSKILTLKKKKTSSNTLHLQMNNSAERAIRFSFFTFAPGTSAVKIHLTPIFAMC